MDAVLSLPSVRLGRAVLGRLAGAGRRVTLVVVLVLGTGTTARLVRWFAHRYRLKLNRLKKKRQCQEALDALSLQLKEDAQISPEERTDILSFSFSDLLTRLKTGRLSPRQVLQAFQAQALEVHQNTNCLVEPIIEAESWCAELETTNKNILPLYGIPVSLKDCYGIQGYDSTVGLANWVDRPFPEDCVIVKVLKEQGAVPFVKTNVPQAMTSIETSNPIFGATTHPVQADRTPGGSSGGEGALVAGRGSVLGFGSDLVGNIRIPAAFCGICGFKPTQGRLSDKGMFPFMAGQNIIKRTYGPMARDVDGIVTVMRALLTPVMFKLDPALSPVPFNEQGFNNKRSLKVGYFTFDGFFHAVPSCERAVLEAVQALQKRGHQVIECDFSKYATRSMTCYLSTIFGDGGKEILAMLAGDSVDPVLKLPRLLFSTGLRLRKLLAFFLGFVYPNMAIPVRASYGISSVNQWWQLASYIQALREDVMTDWQGLGLDVVIFPGTACPALPHGQTAKCFGLVSYTAIYNLLHFPVGSVPVSKVTDADLEKLLDYPTPDPWHRSVKKAQAGTEGLPVGVQVAALPWQDELVLRVMKELEITLKHI